MEMLRKGSPRIRNAGGNTLETSQAAWFLLNARHSGMYCNVLEALGELSCLKICKTGSRRKDDRKREKRHAPDWSLLDRFFNQVSVHLHEAAMGL